MMRKRVIIIGTTSAHAENTAMLALAKGGMENYLRARGEYQPPHHFHPQN
mgnify:CR=1 FL=1